MATSIHTLPPEVLAVIFAWTMHGNSQSYSDHRATLTLVSKGWNRAVKRTPYLWSRISADYTFQLNHLSLTRSRSAPLDIDFLINLTPLNKQRYAVESLKLALQNIQRWRTARLGFGMDFNDVYQGRLETPAPWLEDIIITVAPSRKTTPFVDLFCGQAERLRSVRLVSVCIPWGSRMLSGLELLHLEEITYLPPTIQDILSVLSASPHLSTLKLSNVNFRDLPPESFAHPIIDLPRLQTLHILTTDYRVVKLILRHVKVSSCANLVLKCPLMDIGDPLSFLNLIPPFLPHLDAGDGHINLKPASNSLSYTHSPPHGFPTQLDIHFTGFPTSTFLFHILTPGLRALDTHITIQMNIDAISILQLLASADVVHVTKLEVHSGGNFVLQRLTDPPWIFQSLTLLAINMADVTPGFLSRMIEARYAASSEALPPPFVKLRVFGARGRHLADRVVVAGLLGTDMLEWGVRA